MTPRENLLSLFRRQGYESAPPCFSLCPSLIEVFREKTGSAHSYADYFGFPWQSAPAPRLPDHAPPVDWAGYFNEPLFPGTTFSLWGVAHEPGGKAAKHMTRMRHPMAQFDSLEQFKSYPFPDFINADYSHLAEGIAEIHAKDLASTFVMGDMIWEAAWYMRGMNELMVDMAMDDEKAVFLLDKVTDLACFRAARYAEAGLDVLHTGDDVGMQSTMMMAPEFWRAWLKPRMSKVIRAAKNIRPEILFSYHSCGFIEPIIEDLIEIGVDILNPVQPECMEFSEVHASYGDRLSFWGTIGTQTTMPFGTPEDVASRVRHNLRIAGSQGGLFCTPTHLLEPEVPWANIVAYVKACRENSF
jgi:uroporphyrinogen decarboxylase